MLKLFSCFFKKLYCNKLLYFQMWWIFSLCSLTAQKVLPLWRYFLNFLHMMCIGFHNEIRSSMVRLLQEQFFILKPKEISARSFKLYPATDQAAKYVCTGKITWRSLKHLAFFLPSQMLRSLKLTHFTQRNFAWNLMQLYWRTLNLMKLTEQNASLARQLLFLTMDHRYDSFKFMNCLHVVTALR